MGTLPELTEESQGVLRVLYDDNPELRRMIASETENLCYDRLRCRDLGVDYCNITEGDFHRIALYLLERNHRELYERCLEASKIEGVPS